MMDRWGENRVKTIGTTTRMKPKATIDKTYKACAITFEEAAALKKIVGRVPDIDILGHDSIGWAKETDPGKTIYVMDHVGQEICGVGCRAAGGPLELPAQVARDHRAYLLACCQLRSSPVRCSRS
jgi:hypothetical protein